MSQRYYLISVELNGVFPNSIFFVRLFPSIIVAQIGEKISGNGEHSETSHIRYRKIIRYWLAVVPTTVVMVIQLSSEFRLLPNTPKTRDIKMVFVHTIELDLKQSELEKIEQRRHKHGGDFPSPTTVTTWMGMNLNILPYLLHLLRCLMVQSAA